MSHASQIKAKRPAGFATRFALTMAAVTAVVAVSLTGLWEPIVALADRARPHAPDLSLWAGLSPAIKVHLATALAALVLGAVLMAVRKGRAFHRAAGWTWVALVAVTAGSSLFIAELNNGRWSLIHIFTGWTLIILPLAVLAARRHKVAQHRRHMMGLFYGAFAINLAFAFIPGRTLWMMFFG